jgi:hypothetical protein
MEEVSQEKKWNDGIYKARLAAVLLWSGVVALIWFGLVGTMAGQTSQTDTPDHAGLGGAVMIVSGCACAGWGVGLVVILMIYAILRRN